MRLAAILLSLLALAACDDGAVGPGGVTQGEADALNAAAERIDARQALVNSALSPATQD